MTSSALRTPAVRPGLEEVTRCTSASAPGSGAQSLATSASAVAGPSPTTPVAGFVAAMAAELGLGDSPADRRTARQLRRLSDWATGEGFPLDREVILDPDTVERFVEVGLAGDRSRATYRAVLRRVGPLLTTRASWEPRP